MILRLIFTSAIFLAFTCLSISHANESIRYVALGDSYTIGMGVESNETWPAQLADKLKEAGVDIHLDHNLGQSGWTSQQVIEGQLPLLEKLQPNFVTLLIGTNDWFRGSSSRVFSERINTLLDELEKEISPTGKLLLVTMPEFSCSPAGSKWGYGKSAINGITRLNKILRSAAQSRSIPMVDIFPLSRELCSQPGMFAQDGLHPSALQYSRWVELIFPKALDLLRGQTASLSLTTPAR
jgi:lysophospholipase L1-like esterase